MKQDIECILSVILRKKKSRPPYAIKITQDFTWVFLGNASVTISKYGHWATTTHADAEIQDRPNLFF
jgi:hypothetical protein